MKTNWKKVKLSTIAKITMGQSPKSSYYNSVGEGMPFLQGNRTFGFLYPTFDTWTTMITKTAKAGDVIMSVRAPVGELNITPTDICLGRGVCSIRMNDNNQTFLYYLMKYMKPIIVNKESGTVFGSINSNDINNLEVCIPKSKEIQKKIAKVLSAFDDKIELNNKINENLEQQAQAIFESWFIDFEPFGGKMPSDWKMGILGELTEINSGRRPLIKSDIKTNLMNVPVVGATKIMAYTDAVLYNEKIIVTGRVGTHGIIQKINFPCWCSDNTLVIKTKYYEYVYQQLKLIDYDNLNRGSTQPLITSNDLKKVQIVIPNKAKINEFEKIILPLSKQQFNLQIENEQLANLRDTLLPKLMNGEIDVDKIKI